MTLALLFRDIHYMQAVEFLLILIMQLLIYSYLLFSDY